VASVQGGLSRGASSIRSVHILSGRAVPSPKEWNASQRAQRELHQRDERRAGRLITVQERRGHEEKGRLEQRVAERHTQIQNARMQLSGDNKERLRRAFNIDRARRP
jgi:hypothetical protein